MAVSAQKETKVYAERRILWWSLRRCADVVEVWLVC